VKHNTYFHEGSVAVVHVSLVQEHLEVSALRCCRSSSKLFLQLEEIIERKLVDSETS